jgi:hypothetical protein
MQISVFHTKKDNIMAYSYTNAPWNTIPFLRKRIMLWIAFIIPIVPIFAFLFGRLYKRSINGLGEPVNMGYNIAGIIINLFATAIILGLFSSIIIGLSSLNSNVPASNSNPPVTNLKASNSNTQNSTQNTDPTVVTKVNAITATTKPKIDSQQLMDKYTKECKSYRLVSNARKIENSLLFSKLKIKIIEIGKAHFISFNNSTNTLTCEATVLTSSAETAHLRYKYYPSTLEKGRFLLETTILK